ncbi:membrane protein resembling polysaccharide polymerases [Bordetella holmesii]|nr:membrane protein resembling polysaccharide polymerases [Bordetella holmesii]
MLAGLVFSWNSSGSRMSEVWSEIKRYEHQDRDTSTGIRMQLWHASWLMFKEHPLVGVGAPNFRDELARFEQRGIVTPRVAIDYGEPHNDYLAALACYGLIGLLSFLALYFVPALVFLRRLRSTDNLVREGARIGLLFTLGYAVFSLTEMMFRNMRSVPIYAITMVVLFALTREKSPSDASQDT